MMKAWHFVGDTLRDGRPVPPDGEWLEHDGELELCASGLHASLRLIDALQYAPGSIICRVELDGAMQHDDDKLCAMRRRILWRVDGEAMLRAFARWCALQVAHLWDMPNVVREYLETGNEDLRDAARDAAWAAWAACHVAGWAAAGSAAWAARVAAGDAAKAAARAADDDAAWDAWAAGWAAAKAAAWDAARAVQNEQLERMVREAHAGRTEWVFESAEQLVGEDRDG